jgi:transcriptional regulator with XRE-family HTH domain
MPRDKGIPLDESAREFLRGQIDKSGMTRREVARKCGLQTGEAVSMILNGSSNPSSTTLQSLAKLLEAA